MAQRTPPHAKTGTPSRCHDEYGQSSGRSTSPMFDRVVPTLPDRRAKTIGAPKHTAFGHCRGFETRAKLASAAAPLRRPAMRHEEKPHVEGCHPRRHDQAHQYGRARHPDKPADAARLKGEPNDPPYLLLHRRPHLRQSGAAGRRRRAGCGCRMRRGWVWCRSWRRWASRCWWSEPSGAAGEIDAARQPAAETQGGDPAPVASRRASTVQTPGAGASIARRSDCSRSRLDWIG